MSRTIDRGSQTCAFAALAALIAAGALILSSCEEMGVLSTRIKEIVAEAQDDNAPPVALPRLRIQIDSADVASGSVIAFPPKGVGGSAPKTVFVYNDGQGFMELPDPVSISGADADQFSWTNPPAAVAPGSSVTFSVTFQPTDLGSKTASLRLRTSDPENEEFTLSLTGTCVAPGTVTAPNGGEALKPGSTYAIDWEPFPVAGNVRIELYDGVVLDSIIAADTVNDGSYAWSVPAGKAGVSFRVHVTSIADSDFTDQSDGTFGIWDISSIAVSGGDGFYKPGEIITLTWNTTFESSAQVVLQLLKGGAFVTNLTGSSVNNDGEQSVTMPTGVQGTGYTVRVRAVDNAGIEAQTTAFAIGQLALTKPTGTTVVTRGSSCLIEWQTGSLGGTVQLAYRKGSGAYQTITSSASNSGTTTAQYSWTVPTGLTPGDDYKVKVTLVADSGISSEMSGTFTIMGPALAAPTFSPTGGTAANIESGVFTAHQSVTITAASGCTVCYTTDTGAVDTCTNQYSFTLPVTARETTIRAISVRDFYHDSPEASATYRIPYLYDRQVTGIDNPRGMDFRDGKLYVAVSASTGRRVEVYDQYLASAGGWSVAASAVYDVIGSTYERWVTTGTSALCYDQNGARFADGDITSLNSARGIGISGDIFIADYGADQVRRYGYAAGMPYLGLLGSGYSGPFDWATYTFTTGFWPDQTTTRYYLVADIDARQIRRYSTSGSLLLAFDAIGRPYGVDAVNTGMITVEPGNIFVADQEYHKVRVFGHGGDLLVVFGQYGTGPGEFNRPWGIEVDTNRNVYVSDNVNDRIQKFVPNN